MGLLDKLRALLHKAPPAALQPVEPEKIRQPERRRRPRLDARKGTRALIIDDSPTIVAVLRKMLGSAGYSTLSAMSAERGLQVARKEQPDLIFLDIILPGMNGFAALRALRREAETRNVPIIMISSNEQVTSQFVGTRIGADDFMQKPFSRFDVFSRIERLLDGELVPRRPNFDMTARTSNVLH